MASVVSIQAGRIAPLGPDGVRSAFVKRPISGTARAGTLGIQGDEQADLRVHGGPDKAIYFYASEHYRLWANDVPEHTQLLVPGAFGENVTTAGLDEGNVAIGDVLAIGSAELQVTEPRQPCFKLGLRFADNSLGRIMMQTNRTGWYVRVLRPGELTAGDEIRAIRRPSPQWTIARFNDFIVHRSATVEEMQELSTLEGLPGRWREKIRKALLEGAG
jgi:MOSC domain-containing protein YiiM